jgi:protease IV
MPDQPDSPQHPQGRPPIDPSFSAPPPPPPPPGAGAGYPQPYYGPPPKAAGGVATKVMTSLLATIMVSSIVMNIYFVVIFSQSVSVGPVVEQAYQEGTTEKRIAILPVTGVINDDTAVFVRQAVKALNDNPPAALILRIDSGGGGVGASDRIWHYISEFRKAHPDIKVIASYGSYAASGGYYVSAMADEIYAEPTCVTGSIGVMGQLFTVEGLLEKVGIEPITMVATNSPNKDRANDITRTWTEEDRQVVQVLLDSAHERFVQVVAQGRASVLSEDEVRQIATGQIFTAAEAKEAKIIDEIGYLDDVIKRAAKLSGLPADDSLHITVLGKHRSVLDTLLGAKQIELPTFSTEQARAVLTELGLPRLDYRMMTR